LFVQKVLNHFTDLGHMECSEPVRNSPKKYTPRHTAREIQSAVKIVLPKQLSRYAVKRGFDAIVKYTSPELW
jgi:hypothetical protein